MSSPLRFASCRRAVAIAGFAWCILCSGAFAQVQDAASTPKAAKEKDWFRDYTPAEFRKLEAAQQEIDPKNFREEIVSAAVFHETNKRRAEHNLPALSFHPEVRAASLEHARRMAKEGAISHGTPGKKKNTTPYERLKKQGLEPAFSAENVAFNFIVRYESGKPFYTRQENGRTVYSYQPNGEPLGRHTPVTFAESVLTQWMNSPGHRKNILATEPEFLGVGAALSKDAKGFDTIYVDQDFFAPLESTPPVKQP